jgi:hypothetical protein
MVTYTRESLFPISSICRIIQNKAALSKALIGETVCLKKKTKKNPYAFLFIFRGARDGTQDPGHVRQVLYL